MIQFPDNYIPEYDGYFGHHPINKWEYVFKMVHDVLEGGDVPPYVVCRDTKRLMSGHHRCAANVILEMMGSRKRIRTIRYSDVAHDPRWFKKYG